MSDSQLPEVIDNRRDEVLLFLGDDSKKLRAGGGSNYDLVSEYRKTKGNRTPIVMISIIAVTAVFIGASFLVTRAIDRQARSVSVDIQSFEDLNLQDLLDLAKRNMDDLDRATRELQAFESSLQSEVDRVADQRKAALSLADAMGLTPEELSAKRRAIEVEASAKEKSVRGSIGAQITAKRQEIATLQEKIAAYDAHSLERAKKQQAELDNQKELFDFEKGRLTKFYEDRIAALESSLQREKSDSAARLQTTIAEMTKRYERELAATVKLYNPQWSGGQAASLADLTDPATPHAEAVKISSAATVAAPVPPETLRAANDRYEEIRTILGQLRKVPYRNSVPGALAAVDKASAELASNYVSLLSAASTSIETRDGKIAALEDAAERTRIRDDSYLYALVGYARDENEAGFIVDPRDVSRILIFIDPLYQIPNGSETTAWVFRAADQPIAELRLHREGDQIFGRIEQAESGQTVHPFDRILLKLTDRSEVSE